MEVDKIIKDISCKDYSSISLPIIEPEIKREDIVISKSPNRKPIENIIKLIDWNMESFAYNVYLNAEDKRKNKEYENAILLYEKARELGLIECDVYTGIAQSYHALKDYENEILILDEGIGVVREEAKRFLIARQNSAIKALYKQQETERVKAKKEEEKQKKEIEKQNGKTTMQGPTNQGKSVVQLDDNDNIIAEYPSVAIAAKSVGINEKSIREVAKGRQKHAAGFCWRYKDEI